jgi:hypothetical protein
MALCRRAFECFAQAVRVQPQVASYLQMAQLHQAGGDEQAAVSMQQQALVLSPEDPQLLSLLGRAYMRCACICMVSACSMLQAAQAAYMYGAQTDTLRANARSQHLSCYASF